MFVDSHCHLDHPRFDADRQLVIDRAREAGVSHMITIGADLASSQRALDIAEGQQDIFATVGVHPHDAKEAPADYLDQLRSMSQHPLALAVGEIGLDYHYDNSPRSVQRRIFADQVALAHELDKPFVVHVREAEDDCLNILHAEGVGEKGGVIHCFTSTLDFAKRCVDLGFHISIPGVITYKKPGELINVVKALPLDLLLVETDAPYLAPTPYRGKRNEPAWVVKTAEFIANVTGNSLQDVKRTTAATTAEVFGFPQEAQDTRGRLAYEIGNNLYLNITNDCTMACTFCPKRQRRFSVKGHPLKLDQPPTVEELQEACGDVSGYQEVVFVGLGEPTLRLDVLLAVATWLRSMGKRIRLDTDGLANLVHNTSVVQKLSGLVDAVSVSLNAADAETHAKICPSRHGASAFAAVQQFIVEAKEAGMEVTATVVALPEFDQAYLQRCQKLAEEQLGVRFRIRSYNKVG